MSLAKLKRISQLRRQYPAAKERRSEEERLYEAYLESLSEEELQALYEEKMRELENDPEVIARRERYESMTVEQLTEEIQKALRAS
jgi:hypothetical protein